MTNKFRPERHTRLLSILRSTFNSKAVKRLLVLSMAFPLVCFIVSLQTEARTSPACECNRNAPETIHIRWQPNTALRVVYARGEFSPVEVNAVQDAISSWRAVLPASGTGITIQDGGEFSGKNCAGCIVVRRKRDMSGTFASLSTFTIADGAFYNKAVINIKSDIHKPELLRMLMTHELGHAFGLDDCVECRRNTTVMNSVNRYGFGIFSPFARSKMAASPTPCDIKLIAQGYAGATQSALAAPSVPRVAPPVQAQVRVQSRSVVANQSRSIVASKAPIKTRPETSARHHASRVAGQSQWAVKIEQLALMDALTKRD